MNRVEDHVNAFNQAVASGDWTTFAARFAEDARMTFVGVPAGPYDGRAAITEAYRTNPPTDTMTLTGTPTDTEAPFHWTSGGTGTMHFTWTPTGHIATLVVAFT